MRPGGLPARRRQRVPGHVRHAEPRLQRRADPQQPLIGDVRYEREPRRSADRPPGAPTRRSVGPTVAGLPGVATSRVRRPVGGRRGVRARRTRCRWRCRSGSRLHDQRLLVVTSGSMSPKFDAGDAVVLRAITDESDLKVNQVISFWPVGLRRAGHAPDRRAAADPRDDPGQGRPVARCRSSTPTDSRRCGRTSSPRATRTRTRTSTPPRWNGSAASSSAVHPGWGWVLNWAGSNVGRAVMLVPPLLALATLELLAVHDRRRSGRGRRDETRRRQEGG